MPYIKPANLIYHQDSLLTLEALREHTLASTGDTAVQAGILAKIDARLDKLKASVFEREEPNGDTRVRHPAIGVMALRHELLDTPTQLFASAVKSLVDYTVTVHRADAVISKDGLIRYEPYEQLVELKMTETAFNQLITSPGRSAQPATLLQVVGFVVEPLVPDVQAAAQTLIAKSLEDCLDGTEQSMSVLVDTLRQVASKGSKPTQKLSTGILRETSLLCSAVVTGPSHQLSNLGEFAEQVKAQSRLEMEAAIALHLQKGNK